MPALFTVRLAADKLTVPFCDVPLLIAEAMHGPRESLDEPTLSLFGADWQKHESELEKAFNRGEVLVLDSSAYPMRPPIASTRLEKGIMTVDALRQYLEGLSMALEQADPKPQAAPVESDSTPVVQVPTIKATNNKGQKKLAFEAEVIRLMAYFWDTRPTDTSPTKGALHDQVYKEMLRGKIHPPYATLNVTMVRDAAKPWRKPLVLPTYVPPAQTREQRHPFKGER